MHNFVFSVTLNLSSKIKIKNAVRIAPLYSLPKAPIVHHRNVFTEPFLKD